MGLFDLFKKKNVKDEFSQAISELMKYNNMESQKKVFDIFRTYVEEGKWLFSSGNVNDGNTSVLTIQEKGKYYIPVYTDGEYVKNNNSVIQTDVNKYIESLYSTKEISGLVINPGSQNLYMEKEYILKILLHDKFAKQNNAGSPQKNWGVGIPEYKDSDLMTKGQMLNFAMHVVHDYDLKDSNLIPISYCDNTSSPINYIIKKDGDIFFIVVHPYSLQFTQKYLSLPAFAFSTKSSSLSTGSSHSTPARFSWSPPWLSEPANMSSSYFSA